MAFECEKSITIKASALRPYCAAGDGDGYELELGHIGIAQEASISVVRLEEE